MYRSLSECGSFTEYEYVLPVPVANLSRSQASLPASRAALFLLSSHRSLDPPQFLSKVPIPAGLCRGVNVSGPIHFASVTQLEGTQKTYESPGFLSADPIHVEFVPGMSIPDLAHVNTKEKVNAAGYNSV
jgi:hypothetical protein